MRILLTLALVALAACAIDSAPTGLQRTPPGDGATVVFDLTRRPLPEVPVPNDIATFADPTSRTGLRLNVSLIANTTLEANARAGYDEMEGWGTFAPITVSFSHALAAPPDAPALDLDALRARMQGDEWDLSDDPVYVVNLKTGVPVLLDLGSGSFPATVVDPASYGPNDTRIGEQNLLFETAEESAGSSSWDYRPELDSDFDGVLDHPNTLGPPGAVRGADNLMTWYERETDTLVLRPMLPMDEKTEYAVVLTERLHGSDGSPVKSPFPYVHHPSQQASVARLQAILNDPARAGYFGDLAGTGLTHVAFAWTFTTQPTVEDMVLLRNGLYGKGPFAHLSADFPPDATAIRMAGLAKDPADEPASAASDPRCASTLTHPYVVRIDDARDTIHQLLGQILKLDPAEQALLEASLLENVDHLVIGTFRAPYYLGDPAHEDPEGRFRLNYRTGAGDVRADTIPFWLSVPRAARGEQPFPAVVWSHGTAQNSAEIIARAGYYGRQGLAMFAIDMPGHGLPIDTGLELIAEAFFRDRCLVPWVNGLLASRAHDLDGDGVPDSGGLLWSSHTFHSRDNVRQSVLDQLATTRLLRSFDGRRGTQDFNADGAPDLAGDFDGDGAPDVGGPGVSLTSAGDSYGGIVAMIQGALDPQISATAPISGAGGLVDVATRSSLVPNAVLEQVMSPLVVAVPAESVAPDANGASQTVCAGGERSVRIVVNNLFVSAELEVACLSADELGTGKTITVTNAASHEVRCGASWQDGRFRVALPASIGDPLVVQIYDTPNAVRSYQGCELVPGATPGRRITTWERPAAQPAKVGDSNRSCDDVDRGGGCQHFRDTFFAVGSPLVAPNEGLGLARQTPQLRRLMNLTQAALDPADPVAFAPYYMLRPMLDVDGNALPPRAILTHVTVGDPWVPVAGGIAFARASGAVPFLPPSALGRAPDYADYVTPQSLYDAWGGRTANEVLVDDDAIEGIARLARTSGGAKCAPNYVSSATCNGPPARADSCATTLADNDWLAEGADLFDAPHPPSPLRLARRADVRVTDAASLEAAWAPRLSTARGDVWSADAKLVGLVNAYVNPVGQHVWYFADPCKGFDDAVYYNHEVARFLSTQGADAYFLSHPASHRCLATETCPFLQ